MKIEELLDELCEVLDKAWNLPLSGGKVLMNATKIKEIINDVKFILPTEVKQAKAIVADRSKIINDAKSEAQTIIDNAQIKAEKITDQDALVIMAQNKASELISQADLQAKEVRGAANEYVDDLMKKVDEMLTTNLSEVKKARHSLKSSGRPKQ